LLDFPYLQNLFGNSTFTHPSGQDRIAALNRFIDHTKVKDDTEAFKISFLGIWQMD